jgi:integrase
LAAHEPIAVNRTGGKQERKYDAAWTKEDAEKALAARLLNISTPVEKHSDVTFKTMTDRYPKEKELGGKKSLKNDREAIARCLEFFGAETPLAEITGPWIAEYRLKRQLMLTTNTKRRVAPRTVNVDLQILRGILGMAASEDFKYLEKAPTIRRLKEPQGRLRYLDLTRVEEPDGRVRWVSAEATRLLAACEEGAHSTSTCRSPYLYDIVVVALHTGMRKGEILGLEWPRVDFSRAVIQLEETKNGTRREIPMDQSVFDVLRHVRRRQGGNPVGNVFPGTSARTAFLSACECAGVTNFHFHDLRHTCASWLVMRGRPLREVQELLGHKSIRMT